MRGAHAHEATLFAESARAARALARRAKRCYVRCIINSDDDVWVESSRAAILRALRDLDDGEACGGILWEDGTFCLDRSTS